MNNYFFKDYDDYLLFESGLIGDGKELWNSKVLQESRGIVDDYNEIIGEIYNVLVLTQPIPFNNESCYLLYRLTNYRMEQECFIQSLNIIVKTRVNGENSYFDGGNCMIIDDGTKLKNVLFNISIGERFLNTENGKKEFFLTMSHELQHAYRFFNICLTNQTYVDNENNRKKIYQRSLINGDEKYIQKNVKELYYKTERDEIMSEVNSLFEYLRQNENINSHNYKEYEKELPLYATVETLKDSVMTFDKFLRNRDEYEETIIAIGEYFNEIIGEDISPSLGFIKFRNKVINAAMFASRKYKRTLAYAFQEFNRFPIGENLNLFKKVLSWDVDEIEKELNENKEMNRILGRL